MTDANVVLGRIDPEKFFGGRMRLDVGAARRALRRISRNVEEVARGIVTVANAAMERAIRKITVERGIDPSDYQLVAFGGAGPLHACALAESLRMKGVVVPPYPGSFSAVGMLFADRVEERWRTVLTDRVRPRKGRLFDMRYRGQSYEIRCRNVREFHRLHREWYGFARPDAPVEVVNVGERRVKRMRKPCLRGRKANSVRGPSVLSEKDSTIWIPKGWKGRVRNDGSLFLTR